MLICNIRAPNPGFVLTLARLPPTIAATIMLVVTNIASASSLSGAFALIRFRSTTGEPKDIIWALFCTAIGLAVGMAAGLGFPLFALISAAVQRAGRLVLERSRFGNAKDPGRKLRVASPDNVDCVNAFDEPMAKYANSFSLNKVKTAELGSLFVQECAVVMKPEGNGN